MFGGGRGARRRGPRKGEDLRYDHTVTLQEAFAGAQSTVRVSRHTACPKCQGSGARSGSGHKMCPDCRGAGQVRVSRGFFTLAQTCPRCQGEGQVVENPCPQCRGEGRVRTTDTLTVRIPPGVTDGVALRVPGAGEAGERGAPPGDLFVVVHVKPDERFERDEEDLITVKSISVPLAVLGGETEVPTLEKPVRIHIPAGTQSGTVFRVRGAGMPRLQGSGRGDLLVRVLVDIPKHLTREQKELFAQLAKSLGENGTSDAGVLKRVFGK